MIVPNLAKKRQITENDQKWTKTKGNFSDMTKLEVDRNFETCEKSDDFAVRHSKTLYYILGIAQTAVLYCCLDYAIDYTLAKHTV